MKSKIYIAGAVLAMGFGMSSCTSILDEQNHETYTPEYFQTTEGVEAGVTSLYANLRNQWGNGYWLIANETGTDEYTYGHGGNNNDLPIDLSGQSPLNSDNCRADVLWTYAWSDINTALGVLQYGKGQVDDALIAEAEFFLAFDYFQLVQTFGGVPLDLGAGELTFNTSAVRTSTRNTVPEVYKKAIFPNLLDAVKNLPDARNKNKTGGLTKTAARLLLAKAYLTFGWWLENPNDIPTYPECERKDLDGHDAAWYYEQALIYAQAGIDGADAAGFKLQSSFYKVNYGPNDRNEEILLYADHIQGNTYYGGMEGESWANGNAGGNFARWMCRWDYTFLENSISNELEHFYYEHPESEDAPGTKYNFRSVQREAVQGKDRPWKEMATPIGVWDNIFTDKVYDSRFDGTFAYQFRSNIDKVSGAPSVVYDPQGNAIHANEPVLTFIDETEATGIVYPKKGEKNAAGIGYSTTVPKKQTSATESAAGYSNVGAGVIPGKSGYYIGSEGISRYAWLNLWKNGIYRTDNGTGLGLPNGDSPRPYPILKLSELYLIAAEAAAKTNKLTDARNYVNVLRERAGKWEVKVNENYAPYVQNFSTKLTSETPTFGTVDDAINFILEERSREFFGEGYRWWDLVRTQKWNEVAGTYRICGKLAGDHTPETVTRTINKGHYLRPIPLSQIDALQMEDGDKTNYQNPEYR